MLDVNLSNFFDFEHVVTPSQGAAGAPETESKRRERCIMIISCLQQRDITSYKVDAETPVRNNFSNFRCL